MPKNIFFDRNALRALKFETQTRPLLAMAKDGDFILHICEPVIGEGARQYYNSSIEGAVVPHIEKPSCLQIQKWFEDIFVMHGVVIERTTAEHSESVEKLLLDEADYFSSSNGNDIRDAMIFSMAVTTLNVKDAVIVCNDIKLGNKFVSLGFTVEKDAKRYVADLLSTGTGKIYEKPVIPKIKDGDINSDYIEFLEKADPDYYNIIASDLKKLPEQSDKLFEKLQQMNDDNIELTTRILGFTEWFSPIPKERVKSLLNNRFTEEVIENNYQRLCIEGLLEDTGNHLLPNVSVEDSNVICKEAMSSVMGEILEMLESD